jgi:hypothetical protein
MLQIERVLNKSIEAGSYFLVTVVDKEDRNNDPKPKNNKFVYRNRVSVK